MRIIPEVRALCASARRPALRLLIGLSLIAPAGAFMARAEVEGWELDRQLASQTVTAEQQARSAVADAWREKAMERERRKLTARFADAFDIPFDLADEIHWAALRENVDPEVAFGLVRAESSFRTAAVSPVGAMGLTQLMPSTARWLAPGTTRQDLLRPETNLRVGFRYLRHLIDEYDGDVRLALTAYNRGPGTVDRLIRSGRDPGNGYAEMVLTGESDRHVRLMNRKFGKTRRKS